MTTKRAVASADAVLKEIENLSNRRFLPIIGPVKGKHLASAIKKNLIKKVLEIGTLIGYSAILIAKNLPEDGQVFSIEINPQSVEQAEQNILKANLTDKIALHTGDALEIIPGIQEEFDMVFIDAAKNEYFDYLRLAEPKLRKGGLVFADNVKIFASQMQDFLTYLRDSGRYKSRFIDVGFDGVEISEKLF